MTRAIGTPPETWSDAGVPGSGRCGPRTPPLLAMPTRRLVSLRKATDAARRGGGGGSQGEARDSRTRQPGQQARIVSVSQPGNSTGRQGSIALTLVSAPPALTATFTASSIGSL